MNKQQSISDYLKPDSSFKTPNGQVGKTTIMTSMKFAHTDLRTLKAAPGVMMKGHNNTNMDFAQQMGPVIQDHLRLVAQDTHLQKTESKCQLAKKTSNDFFDGPGFMEREKHV